MLKELRIENFAIIDSLELRLHEGLATFTGETGAGKSIIIDAVFAWPGIGSYAIESLTASDYAPIQGFVLMMGGLYVLLNLLIDIAYSMIDPRVKIEG